MRKSHSRHYAAPEGTGKASAFFGVIDGKMLFHLGND
jgi:hypothetical protein